MLVRVKVDGLLFDPRSGMYILFLQEINGSATLPIWIGKPEADAIALALSNFIPQRPLTHDLIKNLLYGLRTKVIKVVVTTLIENTYYAVLHLHDGHKEIEIDARPSDAIAIALRTESPIFINKQLLEARQKPDDLDEWLKNLKPEDFKNIM